MAGMARDREERKKFNTVQMMGGGAEFAAFFPPWGEKIATNKNPSGPKTGGVGCYGKTAFI